MNVIKKILMVLGLGFSGLIVLFVFLLFRQSDFRENHEPFVRDFMADYSRHWEVRDVRDRVSNGFLKQVQSSEAASAVAVFRRLGEVREISDVSVENYFTGTDGTSGVFVFKAEFDNAPGLVELTLLEVDDQPQVHGLHITPVGDPPHVPASRADI